MALEQAPASSDSALCTRDSQSAGLAPENHWTQEGFSLLKRSTSPAMLATNDGSTIASSPDGFAIVDTDATNGKAHLTVAEKGIISLDYRRQVDAFLSSLPPNLVQWAGDHGVKVAIYNNSEQMPASIRNAQARGHPVDERMENIPMFYDPASKTLVFVEHPALTAGEQESRDKFDHGKAYNESKHVMTYGQLSSFDPKAQHFAPLARNGNHEFGHALDQADTNPITSSLEFDRDFHLGMNRLSADEKKLLHYFVEADKHAGAGHEFDRAKRELFAELFSIEHLQRGFGQRYDNLMLTKFHELIDLMKRDPRGLVPEKAAAAQH